jgi:hypothetical protein
MHMSVKKLKELKINIYRYDSAEKLVKSYYDIKKKEKHHTFKISGERIYIKNKVKEIIKNGLWGYCTYSKNTKDRNIFYWIKKGTKRCDLAELLCHEVSHAIGIKSEGIAIKYGYVGSVVLQLLSNIKI